MFRHRFGITILFVALCVLYVVARIRHLADSCLWFDEIFSVHAAVDDWSGLFSFIAKDLIHPPLFYILLKYWIAVGGESVLWLRLLPVAFSVLAIFPFVRLCRELKLGTPVIALSLFLLAVNGALIKYTQTLRMYSMLMFIGLVSMWLFARYFNRGKSFVPLVITNVLLVYTHYFGWLVIGTEIVAILWFQRIKWRRGLVMALVTAAAFVPWVVTVWQAARNGSSLAQNIAWQPRPGLRELITFVIDLVEPFYFQASNAEPASIYFISTPMLVLCTAAIAWFAIQWKRDEGREAIYLLLLFVALPILIAFVASWLLTHSVWGTRHLIIVLPPAMILIANAMLSSAVTTFRIIIVSLVLALSAAAFVVDVTRERPRYVWCAWNDVAEEIKSKEKAANRSTTIYVFENLVAYHMWFALRDSEDHRIGVVNSVDVRTADETYFLPRGFDEVRNARLEEIEERNFWLVFRTSRAGEEGPLIESFAKRGYKPCPEDRAQYGSTNVFWIKMSKDAAGCR